MDIQTFRTRLDLARSASDKGHPELWRWALVNAHDRMVLHYVGPKSACAEMERVWSDKAPLEERVETLIGMGVRHTKRSLTDTPCVPCGDPRAFLQADIAHKGCHLTLP
jgi:hypothetical protein